MAQVLYNDGNHKCIAFTDLVQGEGIQSNQFAIVHDGDGMLLDPGGNLTYKHLLAEMAGSDMVQRQLERAKTLPFASPNGFVLARTTGPGARDVLVVAQAQHRNVLDAIRQRVSDIQEQNKELRQRESRLQAPSEILRIARDDLASAESRAAALKDFVLKISAKAGNEGKLFGSIGTADIAEAAQILAALLQD
mgnify:CR=1 FL=1